MSAMWPLTLALNIFNEDVLSSILLNLVKVDALNVFNDAVDSSILLIWVWTDAVKVWSVVNLPSNYPVLVLISAMCPLTLADVDCKFDNLLSTDWENAPIVSTIPPT